MSDNVRALPGVTVRNPDSSAPDQEVIDHLEILMERVRTGEVQAVAIAGICSDGSSFTSWKGGCGINDLMAAVSFLWFRFGKACDEIPDMDKRWE